MIGDFRSFSLSLPLGREGYKVRLIGILKHHRVDRASRTEVEQKNMGERRFGFPWFRLGRSECEGMRFASRVLSGVWFSVVFVSRFSLSLL